MNGVGLTAVGELLGHRRRTTTAIYAHLDDAALRDVAQAATIIARAMGYWTEPPQVPGDLNYDNGSRTLGRTREGEMQIAPSAHRKTDWYQV